MADMLVKLYELPPLQSALDAVDKINIQVRPAQIGEEHTIRPWIERYFPASWSRGIEYAIYRNPCSLFIAVERQNPTPSRTNLYELPDEQIVGFAGYDTSKRGMFGPMGVQPSHERRGIGKALLLMSLHAMWNENYPYAIIGWAGPVDWYTRTVGANLIPNSEPGPFRGKLTGR